MRTARGWQEGRRGDGISSALVPQASGPPGPEWPGMEHEEDRQGTYHGGVGTALVPSAQ